MISSAITSIRTSRTRSRTRRTRSTTKSRTAAIRMLRISMIQPSSIDCFCFLLTRKKQRDFIVVLLFGFRGKKRLKKVFKPRKMKTGILKRKEIFMLLTTITTDPEAITEDISQVKNVLSGIDLYKVLSTVILAVICIVGGEGAFASARPFFGKR